MKSLLFCPLAVLGLVAAWPAQASATEPQDLLEQLDANGDGLLSAAEAGATHRLLFERLVRTGDDDGDGQLDGAELTAALTPVRPQRLTVAKQGSKLPGADALTVAIARLDANGDGRITRQEAAGPWAPFFERMLRQADDNKNDRLDPQELSEGAVRLGMVAQLAANRLGIDVQAELAKLPAQRRDQVERMGDASRPGEALADPARAAEAFAQLDANGDGQVTLAEVPEPLAERFERLIARGDRNGDGQLNQRELLAVSERLAAAKQQPADPRAARRLANGLLRRFDADGDGQLTQRESPPRLAENFERADANGDGVLSGDELRRVGEFMQRAAAAAGPPAAKARPASQP
ncbi:MAG: hypothetical protein KDA44_03295 [Planctomycetales bacterium]|nr:hypothetical protein [Planctomycetales bacterium]